MIAILMFVCKSLKWPCIIKQIYLLHFNTFIRVHDSSSGLFTTVDNIVWFSRWNPYFGSIYLSPNHASVRNLNEFCKNFMFLFYISENWPTCWRHRRDKKQTPFLLRKEIKNDSCKKKCNHKYLSLIYFEYVGQFVNILNAWEIPNVNKSLSK